MTVPSEFLTAGNESRVGTVRDWGDVIIGADGIYIFQSSPARLRKFLEFYEKVADQILPRRELVGDSYAAIPELIRGRPGWPIRRPASCPVLVIPRRSVDYIHHKRGTLEARFIFMDTEIAIPRGRFGGKGIKSFLAAAGWALIWDGEPLNVPKGLPLLSPGEESKKMFSTPYISYATIGSGFVIGTVPMLLMLARNMNQDLVGTLWPSGIFLGASLVFFGWIASRRGL